MSAIFRRSALTLGLLAASTSALATNGYLSHGYGIKSQGMAGVVYALPQDAMVAASNPAGVARVGTRLDAGVSFFRPRREASISGTPGGFADGRFKANATSEFIIPELAASRELDGPFSVGLALYGNGGMNTNYQRSPLAAYGGRGSAGVDLSQAFLTPTLAWRAGDRHALGVGVNYAFQRFEARGLHGFAGVSRDPQRLTNNGHDHSDGWGLRLGWLGQLSDSLSMGLAWSSRISMDRFSDYSGLFAERGGFDIPEHYGLGLSWQASPRLTLAMDVQEILYSDVKSVGNALAPLLAGQPLGAAEGPGFGWQDVTVVKLGAQWQATRQLVLRAGYSQADQPIPRDQTFFNLLAPGVITEHVSVGLTWQTEQSGELSLAYTHALSDSVNGRNSIPAPFGGGEVDLKMRQDILGVSWGWTF